MSSYSVVNDQSVYTQCVALARGCYQRAILSGSEAISGATLRGTAKSYSGRYKESARNLIARCNRAGLPVSVETMAHGKRVVVIG